MDDIDKAFYKLTVKERDLARHQLRGAELEIEALKLRVALLGELVEGFDAWATHDDWCDGYSGGNPCSCGLDALRERARANATSVASPAEATTEPAPSLELCGERHSFQLATCQLVKGHEGTHQAHHGLLEWSGLGHIKVDTRPRCGMPNPSTPDIFCDKPGDHEGLHGAYYGWNGKAEVWS